MVRVIIELKWIYMNEQNNSLMLNHIIFKTILLGLLQQLDIYYKFNN